MRSVSCLLAAHMSYLGIVRSPALVLRCCRDLRSALPLHVPMPTQAQRLQIELERMGRIEEEQWEELQVGLGSAA